MEGVPVDRYCRFALGYSQMQDMPLVKRVDDTGRTWFGWPCRTTRYDRDGNVLSVETFGPSCWWTLA